MKIFVSYSSESRQLADALAVGLRQDGHEVFFDRDNLPPGEGYHARIRDDIVACDLLVFLISPRSVSATSYAMTELGLARERWPDPSGHILPVLAAATPEADIPPYLTAVTYKQGSGNVVADALARVARIVRERRRRRLYWAAAAGVLVCAVAAAFWVLSPSLPDAKPCSLAVKFGSEPGRGRPLEGMVLDIVYQGATHSFIVAADGTAEIQVGPLSAADAAWTFEVRSAAGDPVARQPMQGCPPAARQFTLGGGVDVTLVPR